MARNVNPPELARPVGYAHATVGRGTVIALGGQIGWDAQGKLVSSDFAAQFEQALANLACALAAAGGRPEHLVQVRIYVTDKRRYQAALADIGAAWRQHLGKHYPAMALLQVADLLEDGALVEIEGLAVVPDGPDGETR
jgi:enamine deaminase RidA (YjgF/YER057c/UK114 family)